MKTWPVESRSRSGAVRRQLREKWMLFQGWVLMMSTNMLVTWFFCFATPVPVSQAAKTDDEGRRGGVGGDCVNKAGTVTAEAREPHGQKGSGQCCFQCGE